MYSDFFINGVCYYGHIKNEQFVYFHVVIVMPTICILFYSDKLYMPLFSLFKYTLCNTCLLILYYLRVTFNNISAISWLSVLLVKETGVPGENHRPFASH